MVATRLLSRTVIGIALITLFACSAPQAQAAFTTNFVSLLTELQDRSLALSNSTDKVEQQQKKACDKAIAAINKASTSLATDLKTAGKITKALAKAFPNEITTASITINAVIFTNSLSSILTNMFSGLEDDVQVELSTLQTLIDSLPAGKAKDKAQAALDAAQAAIDQADAATDFSSIGKALTTALKNALKGQKTAIKAGAGGGGSTGVSATIAIGGTNDNWVADGGGGAEWVVSSGILDIGGNRGTIPNFSHLSVALCSNFVGSTGTYTLGGGCGGYTTGSVVFAVSSGTLIISTFDTNTTSLSGTFSFDATDGLTSITVTNGQFDLNNLTVTP